MSKLKSKYVGKIFWIADDFKYSKEREIKSEKNFNAVSNLIKFTVSENALIAFTEEDEYSPQYIIKLFKSTDTTYKGIVVSDSGEYEAEVNIELFENEKSYLAFGSWIEGIEYTVIMKVNK